MEAFVKFNYAKEQDDELSLNVGETVTDIERIEEGWCKGSVNGQHGVFPENFVDIRPVAKSEVDPPKLRTESAESTRNRRAKVAFSYTAENEDELSLQCGGVVEILGEEEEGWWRGRFDGKEGVFPSNFVESIKEEEEEEEEEPPPYINLTLSKPADKGRPPSMIAMPGLGGINPIELRLKLKPITPMPSAINESPPLKPTPTAPPPTDGQLKKAKVMFPYTADQPDEITVGEGETVDVISMVTTQDGWWKIRAGNKEGLVPDNFLSLVQSSPPTATSTTATPKITDNRPADNPPLPPKTTPVPQAKLKPVTKPSRSAVELPKLPSKQQPELPKKESIDFDIPRQEVLDNTKAKDKPKRTARLPSRNPSSTDVQEDVTDEEVPAAAGGGGGGSQAPWQKEITKRKPKPPPSATEPVIKPQPPTTIKPAPVLRPKPNSKPSKAAVPNPKAAPEPSVPVPSVIATSKPTPAAIANKEEVNPTTTTTAIPKVEGTTEWKEAFEQLKEEFKVFQENVRQEMQKEIDILTKDIDEERKKTSLMQIDIDRLKKIREYRDSNN